MNESVLHQACVRSIGFRICQRYPDYEMVIFFDSAEDVVATDGLMRIDGHVPDVYAIGRVSDLTVIGEAKASIRDLESARSERQLVAFLNYCATKKNTIFLVATPLSLVNCAKAHVKSLQKKYSLLSANVDFTFPLNLDNNA